ncbi:nucleotide exchange factor GrpE [Candidatus Acetothermia bacterium]|nr:nucleotide exchange factor GrpE [Candidatus Acetothermia bacterium]MBI3643230.1 nucleotide exchange factor GrpE [Candidatus Acetothermia bacterium]
MNDQEMKATNDNEQSQQAKIDVEENHSEPGLHESVASEVDSSNELKRQLQEKEDQIHEYIGRLQRLQADFDNYRKRLAREQEGFSKLIENRIYSKVLPIFDSFDRALRAYGHNHDKDALAEGVNYVYAQFGELLKTEGIMPMEVVGKPFDPLRHEGLLIVEADGPPNVVLEEFERGYQRGDQILRPSRVKVSKRRPAPVAEPLKPETNVNEPERGEL